MSKYSFTLPDPASTEKMGAALANCLKTGDIVLLKGDLGMGKTTFSRGVICALTDADETVVSPTFTLVQQYSTRKGPLFHYDLYRLPSGQPELVLELGWEDSVLDGIVLVEWPDRLCSLSPKDALTITFNQDGSGRVITIETTAADYWSSRLQGLKL